jgi:predicted nucleotidyltransferase component of viral defense system
MIPSQNIVAWSQSAPWASPRQVEQDLIICRALVAIFNDPFLKEQLRFRGGTALNKLHFPKALRYSEDIDLNRTTAGGIGPILDKLREVLNWLGDARYVPSPVAPKLIYQVQPEDKGAPIRLKVEINTSERTAHDGAVVKKFSVSNPWFSGGTDIQTFSNEELLATKLRALLQRRKGRDLLDLSHALDVFKDLKPARVIEILGLYLDAADIAIPRREAEQRMFAKLESRDFLADVKPLLTVDEAERFDEDAGRAAFARVFKEFIQRFPGEPWSGTADKIKQHGLAI